MQNVKKEGFKKLRFKKVSILVAMVVTFCSFDQISHVLLFTVKTWKPGHPNRNVQKST